MYFTTPTLISLITLLSTPLALALPAVQSLPRSTITLTLIDAVSHKWTIPMPSDGTWTPTGVTESISHVEITNQSNVPCIFFGVDGVKILDFPGASSSVRDVGPPQTIVGGICGEMPKGN